MESYRFDVVIIGAGPAGVTAAGALAGTGISVALIEAGVHAGAENWSGCVYFAESLAEPDCFGPAAVSAAPYERQVTVRGTLIHNGLDEIGLSLRDPAVFRNCYTVLRPVYDPYFAALAESKGALLLTGTTVTSLLRKNGRVAGVQTDRGPLHAGVVFIAEGDASHLVAAEGLERKPNPHFLQGVKAVVSLPPAKIEERFGLAQGEGAAYEILIRNASIAGRTAHLNVGGFLYTNRDSLSIGYVVPLDNLRKNFRGDHSRLLEWIRSLPYIKELTADASLSAYGTKLVRSGGWRERPVLVDDGLVVGGASAGLGVDIPFPNFTGPASATGLFFGRAVKKLLGEGRSLDKRNLTRAYLDPLLNSAYGRNARYLSEWPGYFGRSRVLFGRTVDLACGTARFLSGGSVIEAGRFLRSHLLSFRGIRELLTDTISAISGLRLWKPVLGTIFSPVTYLNWFLNLFRGTPAPDPRLSVILNIGGKRSDPASLPWPVGKLLERTSPALGRALSLVYANDNVPAQVKFARAVRAVVRSLSLADIVVLPLFGTVLVLLSIATALADAFRYYVLRTPAEKMLAGPVMAYNEAQRKARDLDAVVPAVSIDAKLALNTYRVGSVSHIRTLWPEKIMFHSELARAGIWWVCPARVYQYDAPLMGRGKVTVNWENCIKCESCWRAEPAAALWGRFTDHRLIYRPESSAIPDLLASLTEHSPSVQGRKPVLLDETLWYPRPAVTSAVRSALAAAAAFRSGIEALPASADAGRRAWPTTLGARLAGRLAQLEAALLSEARPDPAAIIKSERISIGQRTAEGRFFHALASVDRLVHELRSWLGEDRQAEQSRRDGVPVNLAEQVSGIFPDRVVKQWEETAMPEEWKEKLRGLVTRHRHPSRPVIRALSSVSPALGLIAACQLRAIRILTDAGRDVAAGICAHDAAGLEIAGSGNDVAVKGMLRLVPTAASSSLLILSGEKGYLVPLASPGVTITPSPAIGFRSAGLADITINITVREADILAVKEGGPDHGAYLAVALGAGDYLSRRAMEHAAGRVQFPGQMLDTGGRDGIAKLGAVKAMIARVEAWRLLLETLYLAWPHPSPLTPHSSRDYGLLSSALAEIAFGPENGCMAYDAGQVFGGFAYSEDDLLSRFYRDSALYRFLAPGQGAAARFYAVAAGRDPGSLFAPELGDLSGISGPPLDGLVRQWHGLRQEMEKLSPRADTSAAGEALALLVGIRGLLSRVEKILETGGSGEAEAAAAEVLLGLAGEALMKAQLSAGRGKVAPAAVFPVAPEGARAALDPDYEAFCALPGRPHRSGEFLASVFDRSPRYVPEMQLHDKKLNARWTELADWFRKNCSERTYSGLPFERHVERLHNLPPEIVQAVKDNRWLATYIPKDKDGLGWRKAEYYILNSAAGSFGDAGICLLIMASTSIGTTPILLGLEDELPRVREELEPLAKDEKQLGEIGSRIRRIVATFRNPNPGWVRKEYEAVMRLVDSRIRRTRVVKYLAANFLRAFYGAGIAGRRGDFGGFTSGLRKASELFDRLMPDVRAGLEELPRRERCHTFFLRTLGHGGVSAFALTEPTAGSDSGGVKTTAQLRTVKLSELPDGRYSFSPAEDGERKLRYLIDADRVEFTRQGMAYRAPDDTLALIRYDRYDYATDEGVRYYEHRGSVCEFHDIGQVRRTAPGPVYEYYSLTGAKMWITNGSVATQFCLYAQSPEGVTGFIADRHAEGLKVGADEHKTGQRGSPTNEIALDSVRVPREAVIGYEGHGQVNALETLNVGRCGLAAVSGALARKVMAEAANTLPETPERGALLGEAATIIFGSESLAYYLIGLFDRPHESVRMESAIAKFVCSEDLHEILSLLDQAYGPEGQTERFLLEKARRDARILNIYEGTNEVQRFLILKDLIAQAADWPELPERMFERPADRMAETLAQWKNRLGRHVKAAARLGDTAWMDAMLQPGLFLLADMAGEILRLECIAYRREWIGARSTLLGEQYANALLQAGGRAAERAVARLDCLSRKFDDAWRMISTDRSTAEVRAADAAMDRLAVHALPAPAHPGAVTAPLRVLALLRPVAELSPAPRIAEGRIEETVWEADPLDRAALDQAMAMKRASGPQVTLDALLPGRPERERILREAAPLADRLLRLDTKHPGATLIAETVRELEAAGKYDLIILGAASLEGDQGLAPFLAGALGRTYLTLPRLSARADGSGLEAVSGPSVIGITGRVRQQGPGMRELVDSRFRNVEVIGLAAGALIINTRFTRPSASAAAATTVSTVSGAVDLLRSYAAAASASKAEPFDGNLRNEQLPAGPAVWTIIDTSGPKANSSPLRAARIAADLFGKRSRCLVAAPAAQWPALLGQAKQDGADAAYCLDTKEGELSGKGKQELLRLITGQDISPLLFAGTAWNDAFALAAGSAKSGSVIGLASSVVSIEQNADGHLVVSSPAYDGKLLRQDRIREGIAYLTMSEEADLPAPGARSGFFASALVLDAEPGWTVPLPPPAPPTLSGAEVIIDLGYGVRDAAGMELAQELRKKLETMGLSPMFGATRKVTQDLKLLPLDAQIGQTGMRVNPKLIICLGISGAPQHIDWIGARAEILCFNKDPEAPLMKLNQTRPAPRVHPVSGDLFVTVRELIEKLG